MSEYHHELSAYIGCSDTQRIVDGIVGLCSREGMRHIAPTALPDLHEAPSQNNYWGLAVLPGAPGWHVLLALPWNVLCERVSGGGPSRFVALCNALQAPGMLREVHGGVGGYAYGTVTLEADGQGREAISGFIWRHGEQAEKELTWHGYTLPEVAPEAVGARLIESVMPTDWTLDVEAIRSNVEEAHLCGEYAQRLGGPTGKWWAPESAWARLEAAIKLGGPVPIQGGVILTFEWPPQDRPPPRPSRHALALEALVEGPHFFDRHGKEIAIGDRVDLQGGPRATVTSLVSRNNAQGVPEPGGAIVETLGGKTWMVDLKSLRLVARPVPFRPVLGRETLERAAEQGNPSAQYELAMTCAEGIDRPRNHFKAVEWFRKAAEHGHREAQYQFGERLLHGNGVLADRDQARKWFIEAGQRGHVGAQLRLVRWYENEFVYPQDPAEAARWLTKAAEAGDESAQYTLAWKYENGSGLGQSHEQAARWYRKAAAQGHTGAQVNLGSLYKNGRGVPQSYQHALQWYGKAAASEDRSAQYNLGIMYRDGVGVAADRARATAWLRKSADNGLDDAKAALKALTELVSGPLAMRIDIDIRSRAANLSVGEYADLQIPPPEWLSRDALVRAFNAYPTLLQGGKVVWAHIIQANNALFESGTSNCPAEVVFDPAGTLLPVDLAPVAKQLYALRARLPTLNQHNPAERPLWEIANYLEAETTRVFGLEVPAQVSNQGLRISSIYIHRRHLPDGFLKLSYFPILISEQCSGATMVLPSRWWPHALSALWRRGSTDRIEVDNMNGADLANTTSDLVQHKEPVIQRYLDAAKQGQADAQFNLGVAYAGGEGVERDDTEAAEWYRKAAAQGHAKAQLALGILCEQGRGVSTDHGQAVNWYRKAALQGNAGAQANLGHSYETGRGLARDREQAIEWYGKAAKHAYATVLSVYRKAALQGHAQAQLYLAGFYKYGDGVAQDDKQAFEWYFMAAQQGLSEAQFNVGMYYFTGKGVSQDYGQAFGWWHKAAVQGFAAAQFNLGSLYDGGVGVQQNPVEAAKWYRKAADQGHANAQLNLSASYFNGKGVPKNEKLAYFWCLVSCAQGNQHAPRNRDIIEKKLTPPQRAEVQAAARAWKPN
jgi:uncharacterized protein